MNKSVSHLQVAGTSVKVETIPIGEGFRTIITSLDRFPAVNAQILAATKKWADNFYENGTEHCQNLLFPMHCYEHQPGMTVVECLDYQCVESELDSLVQQLNAISAASVASAGAFSGSQTLKMAHAMPTMGEGEGWTEPATVSSA